MQQRTDLEQQRFAILKAARAAIRLKYALMADEEINRRLPEIEDAVNLAISSGKQYALSVGELIDEA